MTGNAHPSETASATLAWLRTRARWVDDAATPVDALARHLGLEVATFDGALHPGVWGYLEPGEDLIFLRSGLSGATRRFTLAHELGHALLHRRGGAGVAIWGNLEGDLLGGGGEVVGCAGEDVELFDIPGDEALQPGQAYNPRSAVEREANAFAVALLMPEEPFQQAYLALRASSSGDNTTRRLAKRFGVSEDAALRRLHWLLTSQAREDAPDALAHARQAGDDGEQRAAARLETPALVMAGPGTGKTSTLVARVSHLVLERSVAADSILALTFSRKAAEELGVRVQSALARADVITSPYVSTIHHFCLDLIGRYGSLIGIPEDSRLASEIELYFTLRDLMRSTPLEQLSSPFAPDQHVRDILQAISRAKDDLISPEAALDAAGRMSAIAADDAQRATAARQREFALIYGASHRLLREQRTLDFGDVIALAAQLLHERGDIAAEVVARWPHLLVDEYQDINRAMDAVLRELVAAGAQLWAVGDADQAIYRFRGADPGIVHRFQETFSDARVRSLVKNYRSRRGILDAASGFASQFSQVDSRLPLEATREPMVGRSTNSHAVHLAFAASDEQELAGLARAITARHHSGRAYRDQVVLLRTRRQVEQVVEGLSARGVPTTTLASALDVDVVKRCLAVVSLLCEPAGAGLIRAGRQEEHAFTREEAVAVIREARRRRRAVRDVLARLRMPAGVSESSHTSLRRLGRMLSRMRAAPTVATGIALYCFSFTDLGARALAAREHDAVDAAALRRLLDLARAYDSWRAASAVDSIPVTDWGGFAEYLRAAAALRLDILGGMAAQGDGAVRVLTVHASKGLEFPVVYLPQLANRRFPLTGRSPIIARIGHDTRIDAGEGGELSEEASLFYVAMTRARDELILSYARRYGKAPYTVSPFLDPIERALGDRLAREEWAESVVDASLPHVTAVRDCADTDEIQASPTGMVFELNELETYQRCPKQYSYRYVDHLWSPPSLVALFSGTVRQASGELATAFERNRSDGLPAPGRSDALALVEKRWREALAAERQGDGETSPGESGPLDTYYLRQAQAVILRLWLQLSREDIVREGALGPRGVSEALQTTAQIGSVAIRGDVEVVSRGVDVGSASAPDDVYSAVIVRYRSGGASATSTIRDLFVDAVARGGRIVGASGRVVVANLATGASAPISLSARQRARLVGEVEAAAAGIARRDFHATPDERICQRCPFASSCPE